MTKNNSAEAIELSDDNQAAQNYKDDTETTDPIEGPSDFNFHLAVAKLLASVKPNNNVELVIGLIVRMMAEYIAKTSAKMEDGSEILNDFQEDQDEDKTRILLLDPSSEPAAGMSVYYP